MSSWSAAWFRSRCLIRSGARGSVATVVVVAVVATLVLTLAAGARRTASAPDRYLSSLDLDWDLNVEQTSGRPDPALPNLPAVDHSATITFVFGGLLPPDGGDDSIESLVFAGDAVAFGSRLEAGRDPDPSSPGEFVASSSFLRATGAQLGDHFTLLTITPEAADALGFDAGDDPDNFGPPIDATLVGVVPGATEMQEQDLLVAFSPALLDQDVGIAASETAVALAPGATAEDLRAQLDQLPDGDLFTITDAEIVPASVREAVSTRASGIAVLAAAVTLAALVVLGQLLVRQVRTDPAEDLTLRALGAPRWTLVAEPTVRATALLVAGTVLGMVAAVAVSGWFPLGFVARLDPDRGVLFDPLAHLLLPVAFGLAVLAWVVVALAADRRVTTPRAGGLGDAVAAHLRRPALATGVRFAFQPTEGRRRSGLLTLLGAVVVLAGVVAGLTFGASLGRLLDTPSHYGDPPYVGGQGGGDVPEEARTVLESDPDVTMVGYGSTVSGSVGSEGLSISAIETARGDPERLHLFAGREPRDADEIVLGKETERALHVGVGDPLTVSGPSGTASFRVVGTGVIPSIEGGDGVGIGGFTTPDGVRAVDPGAQFSQIRFALVPEAPVTDTLSRLSEATGMALGPSTATPRVNNLTRIRGVPWVVAAALGILVVLALAHQLTVSTLRHRRDVAVLRALGASRRWVSACLHTQATVLAVIALVIGVPLGFLLGRATFRAYVDGLGAQDDVAVPLIALLGLMAVLLVLANVVGATAARAARRRPPARTLASE